jgi:hypothetical protein
LGVDVNAALGYVGAGGWQTFPKLPVQLLTGTKRLPAAPIPIRPKSTATQ